MISPPYLKKIFKNTSLSLTLPEEFEQFITLCEEEENRKYTWKKICYSNSESYQVDISTVVIPFTGGMCSTAAVWWALKNGLKPWLLFVDGFSKEVNEEERHRVKTIYMSLRGHDGLPLTDGDNPRLVVIPSFEIFNNKPRLSKYHPVDLANLYYFAQMLAKEKKASSIIWSAFDRDREIIDSLKNYFGEYAGISGEYLTKCYFPFENRESVLNTLGEAEALSKLVWKTSQTDRLTGPAIVENIFDIVSSCTFPHSKNEECLGCASWKMIKRGEWRWSIPEKKFLNDRIDYSAPSMQWIKSLENNTIPIKVKPSRKKQVPKRKRAPKKTPKITPKRKKADKENSSKKSLFDSEDIFSENSDIWVPDGDWDECFDDGEESTENEDMYDD